MKHKRLILMVLAFIAVFAGAYTIYQGATTDQEVAINTETTEPVPEASSASEPESISSEVKESSSQAKEATTEETISEVESANEPEELETWPAPDVYMLDMEGNTVTLDNFKDKPTIIYFWASWCPYCMGGMPVIEDAVEQYGEDVNFILLNATGSQDTETLEVAKATVAEENIQGPVYFDEDYNNQIGFSVRSLPLTVALNAEGEIVGGFPGQIQQNIIEEMVEVITH